MRLVVTGVSGSWARIASFSARKQPRRASVVKRK
jgi:hypothetical protein